MSNTGSESGTRSRLPEVPEASSVSVKIHLNDGLFLRDPQESKLGRSILRESSLLIDELGIEAFTFKKLAQRMGSTEASIYRYFANKHLLLVYLASLYWAWIDFRIQTETAHLPEPKAKIQRVIAILVRTSQHRSEMDLLDMEVLYRIVVAESTKVYHTKLVDEENKQGFFLTYKALCRRIADIFLIYKPNYAYPRTLASTLLEMAKDQIYFAQHLPRLTDIQMTENDLEPVADWLYHLVFGQLDSKVQKP
jgi:AcrR family transcriptional regulator